MPPAKSTRACGRCRQHKSRCLPGSSPNTCATCEHSGAKCIPHVPIRRGTKVQQTIEDLSKQIAALQLALYEQSKLLPTAYPREDIESASEPKEHTLGDLISSQLLSAGISKSAAKYIWSMSTSMLEDVLLQYNEMAVLVPFALCIDVSNLLPAVSGSPILSLAALLVSPKLEPLVAEQLDSTFHRVLTNQAMVQGKQNFDILSGLVTYLLWFHHRYDPETQQFFQYLQLAKAMVEDLQVGKCLDSGIDMISGLTRISLARMLAGLYFVDRGTTMLDTQRYRSLMSIESAREAAIIISNSKERIADSDAVHILDLLRCDLLLNDFSSTYDSADGAMYSRCVCCNTIVFFFDAWQHLQDINPTQTPQWQQQACFEVAERLDRLVAHIRQQPLIYLQVMTIVEWAYLLTALVKLPHLEKCAPERLAGRTNNIVGAMRSHLVVCQQMNSQFFQQSKHLWWLEGVLTDAISSVASTQDLSKSYEMLTTSTYELLEQLTERLCGFRKGITIETNASFERQISNEVDQDKFDQILAQWVNLNHAEDELEV